MAPFQLFVLISFILASGVNSVVILKFMDIKTIATQDTVPISLFVTVLLVSMVLTSFLHSMYNLHLKIVRMRYEREMNDEELEVTQIEEKYWQYILDNWSEFRLRTCGAIFILTILILRIYKEYFI